MLKEFFSLFKSDSLFEQAMNECHEMLEIVREMFNSSTNSLRSPKIEEDPLNIYEMDKKINQFERDVRRKIMTHLTVNPQQDLSSGLVLVSVVIDIERMGDYTKNIYDLAVKYPEKLSAGKYEDTISKMEDDVKNYLNQTIDAFKNQDIDLGRKLMEEYKTDISAVSNEIVNEVVASKDSELSAGQASALCLYLRYLKRISAHSRNLVSSIVNPFERIGYPE
jgi:phosphate uptake regulator